jgi:thioredoxin reductase (NADPH)
MEMWDLVVIGGGVGGCTAAIYGMRYGMKAAIVEMLAPGGQAATATTIENYPGFPGGITGPELARRVHEQALAFGIEIVSAEATEIVAGTDGKWVVKTSNGELETISVIIATGAYPRSLDVPGEKELRGHGVSYCATCDGFFYRAQTVAVAGGGNAAAEEALYLADIAEKVYVIHRRDELRAEQYLQKRLFDAENIEILWNSVIVAVEGEREVERLQLRNTQTDELRYVEVQGVFVAVGHIAKTEWLADLLEIEGGFVVTDELMRTNQPGILACGDIRDTPLRQIATAVGDAAIAAFAAHKYVGEWRAERASG